DVSSDVSPVASSVVVSLCGGRCFAGKTNVIKPLSPNPSERKAAEDTLNRYTSQHLVRLLQIVVDGNGDMAVRQAASIHFKNFIAKNWSPIDPDEHSKILPSDKDVVRQNILVFVAQLPPLLRAQLGECLKTIIHADYPEQWPGLLHWVTHNLQDQQVYGALFVLRILARKYEFKSDEERFPVYLVVEETFPHLLNIFSRLVQIGNPSIEVADLIKLICKIFWSSIYLEIPKKLFDPNVFNAWMVLFLNMLERPVPLEGQPTDPELRKSWGWWKVKKWTVHILNRIYTRFGDLKLQNTENKAFAQHFQKNYAGKILECYLNLLNAIRTGDYLPDRVTNLILQYLSNSISKTAMYNLLQPRLDVVLFEIIFPLMCFNDTDQTLWEEDPHEYVRKGYDIIEDLYSPRTATMDFVSELVRKRGKENLQKFILYVVEIFKREHDKKVCCLGLTSLLTLPADQLPGEALERVFKATLELLVAYKDQVAEAAKEEPEDDDDMDDGLDSDDDDDEDGYDEMGDDAVDGDDVNNLRLRLAAQNLSQTLDFRYQALASGVAQHADQRRVEIEKEKLEKANAAAAAS
ncbi:hypothetical protein M8C21_020528, partial [Ambrosia artemisiifolia]